MHRASIMNPRRRASRLLWLLAVAPAAASCTDLRLRPYRDDGLLAEYHYALGERFAEVDGLKLCYQDYGHGDDVLILPGLGTSIDFWQRNVPALAEQFHVVAVDPPGFGKSEKPDASYELSWICARILAFMDTRSLLRVSIIGGSMGGHLGLLLALNHSDRVRSLVMMGSTGDWPHPGPLLDLSLKTLWNEALVTNYLRGHWPTIFQKMITHSTDMSRRLFRVQMAERADRARYAAEGRASARALRSIVYSSCRDRLADVRVPVLLIWGESDSIHPAADARYMHSRIPRSTLVLLHDSGHEAMIDQPDQFNQAVIAFLRTAAPVASPMPVSPTWP